jgi:hypothetical protein
MQGAERNRFCEAMNFFFCRVPAPQPPAWGGGGPGGARGGGGGGGAGVTGLHAAA